MTNFCGNCGSKLDPSTGLCPKCNAQQLKRREASNDYLSDRHAKQTVTSFSVNAKKEAVLNKKELKTQNKMMKRKKRAQRSVGKIICRTVLSILLVIILAVGVTGTLIYFDVVEIPVLSDFTEERLFNFVNEKNIVIEVKNTEMINETEGVATVIVKMPNYSLLFAEAAESSNPERYVLKALILKDYEVQEIEASVKVTIDHGYKIVSSDEVVSQLLEQNLIEAINSLSEVKS